MSKSKKIMDVIWQIVKFILTLGLSHITNREKRRNDETLNDNNYE